MTREGLSGALRRAARSVNSEKEGRAFQGEESSKAKGLARGRNKIGQVEGRKRGQYSRNRESREESDRQDGRDQLGNGRVTKSL